MSREPSHQIRTVTVFCGSSSGFEPAYEAAAVAMGEVLLERGMGLVYGGGSVGLMGVIADTVLAGGGTVTGVIPRHLWEKEVGHASLSELLIVDSMHERKKEMADRADAFIALPGGMGTFEELFEVLTWTQLGLHDKPAGVLEVGGFYEPLLAFLDRTVDDGFLKPEHRRILHSATDPAVLLDRLGGWQPATVTKWFDLDPDVDVAVDSGADPADIR